MDTIFMNSKNNKVSADPHRLFLSLADKMNLKKSDKIVSLIKLRVYYTWKNIKKDIWKQ